jgi:hypothetical protein
MLAPSSSTGAPALPPAARLLRLPDGTTRTRLSDLMAATTLFDLDRRLPGDGKPAVIYARDKRQPDRPKS